MSTCALMSSCSRASAWQCCAQWGLEKKRRAKRRGKQKKRAIEWLKMAIFYIFSVEDKVFFGTRFHETSFFSVVTYFCSLPGLRWQCSSLWPQNGPFGSQEFRWSLQRAWPGEQKPGF